MNSSYDLRERTKRFSLQVISLTSSLGIGTVEQIIGKQLLRSATSIGAHAREGKHSRSAAELFSKLSVALQEAEETRYWMELLMESGTVAPAQTESLLREVDELVAILFSSTRTLKRSR